MFFKRQLKAARIKEVANTEHGQFEIAKKLFEMKRISDSFKILNSLALLNEEYFFSVLVLKSIMLEKLNRRKDSKLQIKQIGIKPNKYHVFLKSILKYVKEDVSFEVFNNQFGYDILMDYVDLMISIKVGLNKKTCLNEIAAEVFDPGIEDPEDFIEYFFEIGKYAHLRGDKPEPEPYKLEIFRSIITNPPTASTTISIRNNPYFLDASINRQNVVHYYPRAFFSMAESKDREILFLCYATVNWFDKNYRQEIKHQRILDKIDQLKDDLYFMYNRFRNTIINSTNC